MVQSVVADKSIWLKFDSDGLRNKFNDITEATYMKRWCFAKIAQESQEE